MTDHFFYLFFFFGGGGGGGIFVQIIGGARPPVPPIPTGLIKEHPLQVSGAFMVKILNCFHVGVSCKFGT